jgi:hypothetical protein
VSLLSISRYSIGLPRPGSLSSALAAVSQCTSSGVLSLAPPRVSISCTSSGCYLVHLLGLLSRAPPRVAISCTTSGCYLVHHLGLLSRAPPRVAISCTSSGCSLSCTSSGCSLSCTSSGCYLPLALCRYACGTTGSGSVTWMLCSLRSLRCHSLGADTRQSVPVSATSCPTTTSPCCALPSGIISSPLIYVRCDYRITTHYSLQQRLPQEVFHSLGSLCSLVAASHSGATTGFQTEVCCSRLLPDMRDPGSAPPSCISRSADPCGDDYVVCHHCSRQSLTYGLPNLLISRIWAQSRLRFFAVT